MKYYTGCWHRSAKTHTVVASNGDDAYHQLVKWAVAQNIQFPTQFTMIRSR